LRAALKSRLSISINDLENIQSSNRADIADFNRLFRVIKMKVNYEKMERIV